MVWASPIKYSGYAYVRTIEACQEVDNDAERNSCHNQEENDRNSDVASETPQSELPSLDVGGTAKKSILIAPDGTEWLQITSGDSSVGRCLQQNILRETWTYALRKEKCVC